MLYSTSSFPRAAFQSLAAFVVFTAGLTQVPAADVGSYGVAKGILFAQTNAGAPQLRDGYPFVFQATAVPVSNGLSAASVQWAFVLPLFPRFAGAPFSTDRQPTPELLDLFYPNGNYTLTMATVHDGTNAAVLNLTGDGYPDNAPSVANYTQAQSINPSNDFTLRWGSFIGGTVNDFIYVQIDAATGRVFRTSFSPGAASALNGTNTTLFIPSNTLASGRAYAARILFHKTAMTNGTSYPGVTGTASYFTQTDFFLTTTGTGDTVPPLLVSVSPANDATNVPLNKPVVMTFNEPMRGNYSFFFRGISTLPTFTWSPDAMTLVATPTSNWPSGTTLVWVLNPSDGPMSSGDLNRTPLAAETWFRFTTGSTSAPPPAPMLTEPKRLVTGRFQFKLLGESGRTYAAEGTTNFTNWVSLGTNIAFGGSLQFLDTNAPALPRRFYRGIGL